MEDLFQVDTSQYKLGSVVAEGKTKVVREVLSHKHLGHFLSKDDITAGDGKMHDVIKRKGELCNSASCYVFEFLRRQNIPLAYRNPYDTGSLIAEIGSMLPFEVVSRLEADGSYVKREHVMRGTRFRKPVVEFYLKTKGRSFRGVKLPCDDPLLTINKDIASIWLPSVPLIAQEPIVKFPLQEAKWIPVMRSLNLKVARALKDPFEAAGFRLVDFKCEYMLDHFGQLCLADTFSPDEFRAIHMVSGEYYDKQYYRDGGNHQELLRRYGIMVQILAGFLK